MTAMISMRLKSWTVPNFATIELPPGKRDDGVKELPSVAVEDLTAAALDDLVAQWLDDLYKKAGKTNYWAMPANLAREQSQ